MVQKTEVNLTWKWPINGQITVLVIDASSIAQFRFNAGSNAVKEVELSGSQAPEMVSELFLVAVHSCQGRMRSF